MSSNSVNASIITIGDELLIGQTIDTNSAFIGQELNKIGVWVKRRVAVGDNYDDIWDALDEESQHSQIIIITGGLGPTADDITKPLLCDYFGGKMIVNEEVLAHVKYIFEVVFRRPPPILDSNLKQAEVPDNCIVLMNERGTAPGMMFRKTAPNPSEGGASDPQSNEVGYRYVTTDPETYGALKNFMLENRSVPTEAEKVLWAILKGKKIGGYKFRRQHIIESYIADFVCLSKKLIIEVDGLIHQIPDNQLSDEARTLDLNMHGYQVLRFTNQQVLNDTDYVINEILHSLKKDHSKLSESKNPPSEGREVPSGGWGASPSGDRGAQIFISLPGVPNEMKGLMMDEVIPRLLNELTLPVIIHQTLLTVGIGESLLANKIKEWEAKLPSHLKLAYLPHYGMVRLRLTSTGSNKDELEKEMETAFATLKELVKEWLVIDEDISLQQAVAKFLKERKQTVGTAESCTGGYIAHLLTRDPGSSIDYKGSVISYDNGVKVDLLGVSQKTLDTKGAVSEETVRQMAKGALKELKSDYIIATSGIMGPDGGSEQKPVGLVWIAVGDINNIIAKEFHFRFDRSRNIEQTAITALDMLRKFILSAS